MSSNGIICAKSIIKKYAITEPNEIPIEDIIINEGIYLSEKNMSGAEGRMICYEDYAVILVNSSITDYSKKRFIIAHEFGHYLMHRKSQSIFNDIDSDFLEWKGNKSVESEANEFAAELLMPTDIFLRITRTKKFSLEFVKEIKDIFKTSLTASSIRFAEKGHDPILLIYSKKGVVKWFVRNKDFPFSKISVHNKIPINTITHDFYTKNIKYLDPYEILPESWNISDQYNNELKYYEQCLYFDNYDYVLTFIWIEK
jgi:Zn-dependent peptidase ImmA (M78 family)